MVLVIIVYTSRQLQVYTYFLLNKNIQILKTFAISTLHSSNCRKLALKQKKFILKQAHLILFSARIPHTYIQWNMLVTQNQTEVSKVTDFPSISDLELNDVGCRSIGSGLPFSTEFLISLFFDGDSESFFLLYCKSLWEGWFTHCRICDNNSMNCLYCVGPKSIGSCLPC